MQENENQLYRLEQINRRHRNVSFISLVFTCAVVLISIIMVINLQTEIKRISKKLEEVSLFTTKEEIVKHPTKEEWLNVYLVHAIRHMTDSWRQRIGIMVAIANEEKQIVVTIGSANGQEEISLDAQKRYEESVMLRVKGVLEDYEWTKGYKVIVQFN